jgi:hypothetical protein
LTFGSGSTLFTPTGLQNGETIGSVTLACTGGPATTAVGSYTITPSLAIGGTFAAGNYSITYAANTLTVNAAALTVTANDQSKTYGQTLTFGAGSTLFTPAGLQNGETIGSVTLACTGGASNAAATTYTITPSLATGGTFTAGNYTITYAAGTLTVNKAALTITANDQSKTYGQTVSFGAGSTLFTPTGLQNGETIGSVTLACTGGASNAAVTTYTITPSLATGGTFTAGNYSITYATGTLTVNPAALTVTASNQSKTYGSAYTFGAGSSSFTSSALQNGETIGTVTLACTGGPATTAVGTYTITPSAATGGTFTASNYSITYNTGTLTVLQMALTITANAQSKTYGQTVTFGAGSTLFTSIGLKNGETIGTVTLACTGGAGNAAVGTYTITPSAAIGGTFTASNYSITYATGTLTVNKAALTVTASAESKTYGQTLTFGAGSTLFTSSGLQNGETIGTVTLACTGGPATTAVGTYTITPSLATGGTFTAGNYSITYNTGTLTVTKGTSTTAVTSSLNPAAPGHSVTFTATVTPSAAAGTVTFKDAGTALPGSSTVTLSGGVATFAISTLSTGSHTITAVYNGDSNCTGSTSPTLTQTVGIVMTNIGQNNSTTSNTSLSVTVPAGGVAVGNTIIVSFAMDPNAGAVSVADTSGNTYHTDADVSNTAGGIRTLVICAPVTTALAAGNTITVTYPATTSKAVSIYYVDGTATSDKTSTGMGTSTAPSSGNTAATTQASELLIGAIGSESYNTTFTVGGSYIAMNSAIANTGTTNTSISIFPEYRVVSATGAYSATGTLSTSRDWAAAIVTYIVN